MTDPHPEDKLRLFQLLLQHESWAAILKEALQAEVEGEEKFRINNYGDYFGWEWFSVHTPVPTLHKMVTEKVLDITLSSRSGTHFKVRDPELVTEVIKALEEPTVGLPPSVIPDNLFDIIVGHDNIKTIVRYAIDAEKPVHLLFSGPPASAKTLFLMELSRLPESYYCLAQTTTQAGLANLLFVYQPQFLLIDEVERLSGEHVGVLNSLMATGVISESKFNKTRHMELTTKVFAAGIRVNLLPKDLMSRFTRLKFDAYIEPEFIKVATKVLTSLENSLEELAIEIARSVWAKNETSSDIRQCVQVARLCSGDPDRAREILKILRK